jgi:hypothetical protein
MRTKVHLSWRYSFVADGPFQGFKIKLLANALRHYFVNSNLNITFVHSECFLVHLVSEQVDLRLGCWEWNTINDHIEI